MALPNGGADFVWERAEGKREHWSLPWSYVVYRKEAAVIFG